MHRLHVQGHTPETILEPLVKRVTIRSGLDPQRPGRRGYVVILHTSLGQAAQRRAGAARLGDEEDGSAELHPRYRAWLTGGGQGQRLRETSPCQTRPSRACLSLHPRQRQGRPVD